MPEKTMSFQKYLPSIGRWHTEKSLPEIIADQHEETKHQSEEIKSLKEDLKKARKLKLKSLSILPTVYAKAYLTDLFKCITEITVY